MIKVKKLGILLIAFCLLVLTGCGEKTSKNQEEENPYVTVELSDGVEIERIFSFKSTCQNAITGGAAIGISDGVIKVGTMENGNSIIWRSNYDVFVHVEGKSDEEISNSIAFYGKKLNDEAISFDEFKKQYGDEISNEEGE